MTLTLIFISSHFQTQLKVSIEVKNFLEPERYQIYLPLALKKDLL